MKKLISLITVLFIGLTVTAQTALNKTVPMSNVEQISVYGTGAEVHFSTPSAYMTYNCGDFAPTNVGSGVNDILGNVTVGNDTLSISFANSNLYYGINTTVTNGSFPHNMNTPVNAITSDMDSIYAIAKFGSQFNIYQIQSSVANLLGSNFTAAGLENYTDIEYFELGGVQYLAIIHPSGMSIYDMSDGGYYLTEEFAATSVTVSQGIAYFSKGNEIYEITAIGPHGTNPIYKAVTSTVAYTINSGQTINEFAFGPWGGDINVAATDGVYSECTTTVGIDEENAFGEVTLYPNPNNGNFTISNLDAGTNVNVLNPTGQIVFSEVSNDYNTNIALDFSLPNGIYFVQLSNGSTQRTIKFIKQ